MTLELYYDVRKEITILQQFQKANLWILFAIIKESLREFNFNKKQIDTKYINFSLISRKYVVKLFIWNVWKFYVLQRLLSLNQYIMPINIIIFYRMHVKWDVHNEVSSRRRCLQNIYPDL